jgi:hypothetical protein
MIKKIPGEVWKNLQFPGWKELRKKYAVSNLGRVTSYNEDVNEDGKLLNGSLTTDIKVLIYTDRTAKGRSISTGKLPNSSPKSQS